MPKWKDLKRFCDADGWECYKSTDHFFLQKKDGGWNDKKNQGFKGQWGNTCTHVERNFEKPTAGNGRLF